MYSRNINKPLATLHKSDAYSSDNMVFAYVFQAVRPLKKKKWWILDANVFIYVRLS